MQTETPLAFIYTRMSQNRDPDRSEGIDRQDTQARRFCEAEGAEVAGVYCDDNVSGSKLLQRRAWDSLWRDAAQTDGTRPVWVVARDTDRLTRNKREAIDVMDKVETTGVRLRTYDRAFDTERPEWEDDLMYRVMGGERYSRSISKNQKMKQEQLLEAGAWRGGPRPFGYYPQVGTKLRQGVERPAYDQTKVRPEEADLIKSGTRAVLNGDTLSGIARTWNESGIPTSMGRRWSAQTVKSVLVRLRNAGLVEHKGQIYGEAAWPAIVTKEDVMAVRAALRADKVIVPANGRGAPSREQARNTRPKVPRVHMLSGVLSCARTIDGQVCGGRMNQKRVGQVQQYACKACHANGIDYGVANERITAHVAARLSVADPAVRRVGGANLDRLAELARELGDLEERKAKLTAAEDSLDYDVFLAQQGKLRARREAIEAERAGIRSRNAVAALIEGISPVALNLHGEVSDEAEAARKQIRERLDALAPAQRTTVLRALGRYEVVPHERGTRPTKETARHRIRITPLNPLTGEPYVEEQQAV